MERKQSRSRGSRRKTSKRVSPALLQRTQPNAAGIDSGSEQHHVAVPSDRDPESVRWFQTFTAGLHGLADWLVALAVEHMTEGSRSSSACIVKNFML